jgi:uncharacterized protein (UPF0262 family)
VDIKLDEAAGGEKRLVLREQRVGRDHDLLGGNFQFPVRLSKSPPRMTLTLVDFKGNFRYDL